MNLSGSLQECGPASTHRRATDIQAGSISPQKLYGVTVALMLYDGAPRLREWGVTVPGLQMAIQAAWAWTQREQNIGMPETLDVLAGWIADPVCQ